MSDEKETTPPTDSAVMAKVKSRFDGATLVFSHSHKGDDTVVVKADEIHDVMEYLRNEPELDFDMMIDLTVVDYLNDAGLVSYLEAENARFEVVYHLYSVAHNHRIRVKAPLRSDDPVINSVTGIWIGADWPEREAFDLYGVTFRGHQNLKRILLYEEFVGHPLRKDYSKTDRRPLIGPRN